MESQAGRVEWPVRAGAMPPLADGCDARSDTVIDLAAALAAGAVVVLVPVRVAGEGPGGWLESCGKTQLAVGAAEALWRGGRLELLVWITASSRSSVLAGYCEAAIAALGAWPPGDCEAAAARFTDWLSQTSRPWLVVFDDLRDTADLDGLWPRGPAGRVLITTPNPAAVSTDRGALVHPVGIFTPAEAVAYLTSRLGGGSGRCHGAEDLAAELGYEPLALAQAVAVITSAGITCHDYQERVTGMRARLAGTARTPPPSAAVTSAISAEHAEQLSPGGATHALLTLAALLDRHTIPVPVFTSAARSGYLAGNGPGGVSAAADGTGPADGAEPARAALTAVTRAGLLSVDPAGTLSVARMSGALQAAVLAAASAGTVDHAVAAAATALVEVWPDDDRPPWLAGSLRACVDQLRQVAGERLWAEGCHPVLLRAGQSLDRGRLTSLSVAYWGELAKMCDRMLGQGHPDTLAASECLAAASLAAGRAAEAVAEYQSSLAERVRVLGPDHPSAIAARRNVGHALVAAKQFDDAITVLERVVADYERVRGAEHSDTLAARDELAAAYRAAGRLPGAIRLLRQTLAARERQQGQVHRDTVSTRLQLADACLDDGEIKPALSLYKRVVAEREQLLGPDHLDTIWVRRTLASAYYAAGRMGSALQLGEEARAGYERVAGPDHPGTLASSAELAHTYYALGRVTDAITLLRDTLARGERTLPPGDPLTQAIRHSLASMTH